MKLQCACLTAAVLVLQTIHCPASALYVDLNSTNPVSPYADWSTAATNIQDAVDASSDGDQIWVNDGVYTTGGRVVYGSLTNRVVVNKAVTVQSVNGPAVTIIQGNQVFQSVYGDSAVRCVYLVNNAILAGFKLQGGATRNSGDNNTEQTGGGLWCESTSAMATNCVIFNNSAPNGGGGAASGSFYNCTFNNNSTTKLGGGVSGANLYNCVLTNNSGQGNNSWGGGAYMCFLSNSVLSGNSAYTGGAARSSTLNSCTVTNNHVSGSGVYSFLTQAGGLNYCTANYCIISGNSASAGGGCSFSTLNECIITGNSASSGGGAYSSTLNNCTLVGNSAGTGGGDGYSTLNNCIIYYNSSPDYNGSALNYCCTTLLPTNGVGNFTNAPLFVNVTNDFHLSSNSPCINAGSNSYSSFVTDLDGNPRIIGPTVDVGAYEYQLPTIAITTQPLSQTNVGGQIASFNVVAVSPYSLNYQWQFNGTNINEATDSTLVLSNIQPNNAGVYSVLVSNAVVFASSSNANLIIIWPSPVIITQPTDVAVVSGSNALFSLAASSYYATNFQWQLNGTNLVDGGRFNGSMNAVLTIDGTQNADAGTYQAIVSNEYGAVTSSIASLTVYDPVQITSQPASQALLSSKTAIFTVLAAGKVLDYQWYFNGIPLVDDERISGSESPTLNIADVQTSDTGSYMVVVTNLLTTATSSNATLIVYDPVQITGQPTSIGVFFGNNASFTVTATGTALSYQWCFNGIPLAEGGRISGSASPTLKILNVQSNDFGSYTVVVTNLLSATNSLAASLTLASVRYVNVNCVNPASPYTDWSTAAANIQDAIDVSTNGDVISVTNGVYQTGGWAVYGSLSNRVVINKAVTVQSINGPALTIIQGYQVSGTTNGDSAVRCVYMTNNATLIGFTLKNGATRSVSQDSEGSGGGVWCESVNGVIVSNCVLTANAAYYQGGGDYQGTLINCALSNNSVISGAYGYGGGASQSYLVNCTVTGNSVHGSWDSYGGGSHNANLTNCVLADNSSDALSSGYGGGADGGNLVNCTITRNFASSVGGGTSYANQINCVNYYNICYNPRYVPSTNYVGGSFNHCCTTPLPSGAGNISGEPLLASASHLSLNSPCRGAGNAAATSGMDIDGEPWANPPSIGCDELYPGNVAGNINVGIAVSDTNSAAGYAVNFQANISGLVYGSKWDFGDGTVVSNEPYMSHTWSAIGDYPVVLTAYNDSFPTGQVATIVVHVYQPTTFYVVATNPTPVAPYDSWAKAATNIQNAIDVANPGNLILVSNGVYKTGSKVSSDGANNRVVVTKPLKLQGVNGLTVTMIDGGNTLRCLYLTNGAVLTGFTLTNGNAGSGGGIYCTSTNVLVVNCLIIKNSASSGGGGAYNGTLTNCTITGNIGRGGAGSGVLINCSISNNSPAGVYSSILNNCLISSNNGGGAISCTLNNCTLSRNTGNGDGSGGAGESHSVLQNCIISWNTNALGPGGGVGHGSHLVNCLIIGNSSSQFYGAAADSSLVNCTIISNCSAVYSSAVGLGSMGNCIVYYNFGNSNYPNYNGSSASYCCTVPLVPGLGNFTNAPLFANSIGNVLQLRSNSPCINAGNNPYITNSTDLDGNPRIVGGTVDIGACEFQTPSSVLSYIWAQQYGLPIDGSADYLDLDGTGMNNWQKWIADLNPTNPASVLVMLTPVPTNNPPGLAVSWQSVNTRTYYLQSSTNLGVQPTFSSTQSNLVGQAGTTSYTDTNAVGSGPYFYRVGVQ